MSTPKKPRKKYTFAKNAASTSLYGRLRETGQAAQAAFRGQQCGGGIRRARHNGSYDR